MSNDFVDGVMDCGQFEEHKTESVANKNVVDVGRVDERAQYYNRVAILAMPQYRKQQTILLNVLDKDKIYTIYDVEKLVFEYIKSKGAQQCDTE